MDFRILGPLEVLDEEETIALGGRKQRALLALLLVHVNETLSTDRLIEELWGDQPPGSAAKTVQVHISRLRKALAAGRPHDGLVVTRDRGYALDLHPEHLDAHRFERLVAEGGAMLAAGRPRAALSTLERALALWRGTPLEEVADEPFAERTVARLQALRLEALEQLVDGKLALGRHAEVLELLQRLIEEHPYRERLRGQLMLALYRSDRQAEALQAYQEARRTLVEQLGIEPGERLRSLERAILSQDPNLQLLVPDEPPAGAFSPQGPTPSLRTAHGAPLLERERELDQLRAAWTAALDGHGTVVAVDGAAGCGKSALLAATAQEARADGLQVLGARGSELESGLAFGAIRQLFETLLTAAAPDDRDALLGGAAAPAGWVVAPGLERADREPRAEAGFAVLHGIYWLATNVSLSRPLLLVVDDLHWVDASSARALAYLARRIADLPLALVVALRRDEPDIAAELLDELLSEPQAVPITLGPLGADSSAVIVRAAIPNAGHELCSACFEASAGNPFYLHELVRWILAEGAATDAGAAVREASLPAVADRVGRRIARVGADAVALARSMSVLGDGGRLADAAALALLDQEVAATAASRLRRIEVLEREDPFAFAHPLVRRSVYDALSVAQRETSHLAAAARLRAAGASSEAVATHLAAVRPVGSESVAAVLREAARQATARAAPEAAIGWLRRALEEDADEPPRAVLLHELGRVELFGRDPAAIGHLQEAHELAADPVLRARIALELAEILVAAGRWDAAVASLSEALDELGDLDPELAVELETFRVGTSAFDPRLVAEFDRNRERLAPLSAGPGWAARALAGMLAAHAAARGEHLDQVHRLVELCLRDGELLAERGAGGWASAHPIVALLWMDDLDRAAAVVDELAAEARRSGALIGTVTALIARSAIHIRRGELAAAEVELRTALDSGMHAEMPLILFGSLPLLNDALLERPSLGDVTATVETTELEPAFLATGTGAMLLEARGRIRLTRGEPDAVADLRAAAAIYGALRFGPSFSPWRSVLALALPPDAHDEARALVEEELSLAAATGLARPQGVALRADGLLKGGQQGIDSLRKSIDILLASPGRLELARSVVALGAALRRGGQRSQAREQLSAGMELAHRCGAERLVGHATEELRAAGARPRRPARTGVDALTPSEERVARLAGAGYSNQQIAQELFVSLKTVETHLSHAYAKLGLSGAGARDRVGAALAEAGGS